MSGSRLSSSLNTPDQHLLSNLSSLMSHAPRHISFWGQLLCAPLPAFFKALIRQRSSVPRPDISDDTYIGFRCVYCRILLLFSPASLMFCRHKENRGEVGVLNKPWLRSRVYFALRGWLLPFRSILLNVIECCLEISPAAVDVFVRYVLFLIHYEPTEKSLRRVHIDFSNQRHSSWAVDDSRWRDRWGDIFWSDSTVQMYALTIREATEDYFFGPVTGVQRESVSGTRQR